MIRIEGLGNRAIFLSGCALIFVSLLVLMEIYGWSNGDYVRERSRENPLLNVGLPVAQKTSIEISREKTTHHMQAEQLNSILNRNHAPMPAVMEIQNPASHPEPPLNPGGVNGQRGARK